MLGGAGTCQAAPVTAPHSTLSVSKEDQAGDPQLTPAHPDPRWATCQLAGLGTELGSPQDTGTVLRAHGLETRERDTEKSAGKEKHDQGPAH